MRFHFLCETLAELRKALQAIGGDILIEVGLPEDVLPVLVETHQVSQLYYQEEITSEETAVEGALTARLKDSTCTLHPIWGLTLYHIADAPFVPTETPLTSKAFRIQLTKQTEVRPLIATPTQLPPMVAVDDWGILPTA